MARVEFDEPIPQFNTRFEGKLESILESIRATYSGKYLNATILEAAAAYFNQLVRGHAFLNGNKRIAVLYTHVFLLLNGIDYTLSYKEMYNFAVEIARAGEAGLRGEDTKLLCIKIIEKFTEKATKIN